MTAHVDGEVRLARRLGVPVERICLYPVLDHPGWDNERPCPNDLIRTDDSGTARLAEPQYADQLAIERKTLS